MSAGTIELFSLPISGLFSDMAQINDVTAKLERLSAEGGRPVKPIPLPAFARADFSRAIFHRRAKGQCCKFRSGSRSLPESVI
jgi:hypothetical protein